MKIISRVIMCVLVVVLFFSMGAPAAQANPGLDIVVVYASDNVYMNDVKSKLEGIGLFNTVDTYDTQISIPSLAELQNYDAVLVYSNWVYDGTAMGDVLADYMDGGGGVVLACGSYESIVGWGIFGRIKTDGYLPFTTDSTVTGVNLFLVPDLPGHEILNGLTFFDGGASSMHNASIAIVAGAILVAHWANGQPLVATYQPTVGRIVGLNFFPPSSDVYVGGWYSATDGALLMANALVYAAGDQEPPPPPVPGMTEWGMMASAIILAVLIPLALRRRELVR